MSDPILDDLFSEFDVHTNNNPTFDGLTNEINYSQSTPNHSLSYDIPSHATTMTKNNTQNRESLPYKVFSASSFDSLIEPHQQQQSEVEFSSSAPSYIPIDYDAVIEEKTLILDLFSFNISVFISKHIKLSIRSNHYYQQTNTINSEGH